MSNHSRLTDVPIDPTAWGLAPGEAVLETHHGRPCLAFVDMIRQPTVPGVQLVDGVIEADMAVSAERSFHGVVWHHRAPGSFEQFFVRPHQVGNPDAIQYTPVTHGVSSWQLYHGPGYWAPIRFPIDAWFTIRVEVQGARADIFVGDPAAPALRVTELKLGGGSGGVGLQVGGPGLRVARFAYGTVAPRLAIVPLPAPPDGTLIATWDVSDPFPETLIIGAGSLPEGLVRSRRWDCLAVERSGLANLARLHEPSEAANTVLVRAVIEAAAPRSRPLELGYSDRAVVFLNGRALYRGDATYRSRDYRFLGSIGFWETIFLPLDAGRSELIVAVSEDLGGWGVQARFRDP